MSTSEEETPIYMDKKKRDQPTPSNNLSSQIPPAKRTVLPLELSTTISDEELFRLKTQYRGRIKEQKKVLKPSEKFKTPSMKDLLTINENDDTSIDPNNLYASPLEIRPMFGRGLQGGLDEEGLQTSWGSKKQRRTDSNLNNNPNNKISNWNTSDSLISQKSIEEMTEKDWRILREDYNITVKGNESIHPLRQWDDAQLPLALLQTIKLVNYTTPTPIQRASIPVALEMRDVVALAETGTGKTAAYVIPLIAFINRMPRLNDETAMSGPYGLILAPTRELVIQIEKEIKKLCRNLNIRVCSLYGGESIEEQIEELSKGAEIIVAAPGRIKALLEDAYLVLGQCYYVVLDEADKMVDMGLDVQVRYILNEMPPLKNGDSSEIKRMEVENIKNPKWRTTLMYSATMPNNLAKLTEEYLRRPLTVMIGKTGNVAQKVRQEVVWVNEEAKKKKLINTVRNSKPPVIVFVNQQKTVEEITELLSKEKINCIGIHGGKKQTERNEAMEGFRKKRFDVVVATNVLSRGIDVENVNHVINYEMPKKFEDYTHRVGRTGRAGKGGTATSFVNDNDGNEVLTQLRTSLVESKNRIPMELDRYLEKNNIIF
ncbi:RNA helicase [Entamoeba marina]